MTGVKAGDHVAVPCDWHPSGRIVCQVSDVDEDGSSVFLVTGRSVPVAELLWVLPVELAAARDATRRELGHRYELAVQPWVKHLEDVAAGACAPSVLEVLPAVLEALGDPEHGAYRPGEARVLVMAAAAEAVERELR